MNPESEFAQYQGPHGASCGVASALEELLPDDSSAYHAHCLARIHLRLSRLWLIDIAGFLYAISMHKFATRDPLSTNTGIEGLIETLAIGVAFLCTLVASRGMRRQHPRSMACSCFVLFGLFALASFWRSFYPSLSLVKGLLFLAVLGSVYLSSLAGFGKRYLRSIYWSYVALLAAGLAVGLLFPQHYPLFSIDAYSGRTRLSVFDTFPGTIGEDAGLLLLIAPLIHERTHWISEAFLFVMNVFAGGKTSTALLCVLLLIRFLSGLRQWRSRRALAIVLGTACIATFSVLSLLRSGNEGHDLVHAAESIYGTGVATDATSVDGRLALWTTSLKLIPSVTFLGFGLDGTRAIMLKVADWSGSSHNGYLELALSAGILGFAFLLVGICGIVVACSRVPFPFHIHANLVLAFILINSFIGGILTNPSYFGLFILLWLSYRACDTAATDGRVQLPSRLSNRICV